LIKSMLNNDSSIIIPSKIDSLFDEFADELTLLKSIPPGIDETNCHLEEEIRLTKRLLYDNSSPRPPKEIVSDNSNADIKSFSPSPIPIKDSDSHMEEIDLSLNPVEPNSRDFTMDVVENISPTKEPQVLNTVPTHPTLQLNMKFQPSSESLFAYVVWIFLPFLVYSDVPCYLLSLRNEDIIFDPGICTSTFSKPDISHRLKKYSKKDKIESKLDKNEKRGEAEKMLKQLQWIKEEKPSKTQKEWLKTQTRSRVIQSLKKKRREQGPYLQFLQSTKTRD
nr:hypothetical protein [Tanacetum cinerariifolium]